MPPYPSQEQPLRLDLKLLAKLVYELNIARHHTLTYPPGHPVISQSLRRALEYLEQLKPEKGVLSLGISKNRLAVGQTFLDEKNPVFREFAAHLFNQGIAVVHLRQGLDEQQLGRFLQLVGRKREALQEDWGLPTVLQNAGIDAVAIDAIDYSAFAISQQVSDVPLNRAAAKQKEAAIWERLVGNLLATDTADVLPTDRLPDNSAPQLVAEQLNERAGQQGEQLAGHYDRAIAEFLRELDREQMADLGSSAALARLKSLAAQLHPALRAQMLNSTFRAVAEDEKAAQQVLSHFPGNMLLEALETLNARRQTVPPIIFTLLDRLPRCETEGPFPTTSVEDSAQEPTPNQFLAPLTAQDRSESFIPGAYGETLRRVDSRPDAPATTTSDSLFWQASFHEQSLEGKISDIVFTLARSGSGQPAAFSQTLQELCRLFIDTGDFAALGKIYAQLRPSENRVTERQPVWMRQLRRTLEAPSYVEQILDTLPSWGKEAFAATADLLSRIGPPVIAPLLDRLAVESNRALRQFYMNCLVDQGAEIREQVIARLQDHRWYYLRNLIVILRRLKDPALLACITPLWDHPHEKVRHEVLKTALVLHDPRGATHLLEELGQDNGPRCLAAVKLARHSRDPQIRSRLLGLFASRDLSLTGLQLKFAALDALLDQESGDLLPHLERKFRAVSFWHPRRQMRLRQRILGSLRRLPPQEAQALLDRLSCPLRPQLARRVREARAALQKEWS